ncbi:hypothetical protein LCGC14_1315720 [marine sediment metagenome]|uniref:Uncharacterized protein n=1 Tax=marine sediment metagenome TaxID=412755 RepID=A0A0F9N1Y5_9ZZZZ
MVTKNTVRCNGCGWEGIEEGLKLINEGYYEKIKENTYFKGCKNCRTDEYLMDI